MTSWLGSPTLQGKHIRLRPLVGADAEALAAAVDEPDAFRWTSVPGDVASAGTYISTAIDNPHRVAFAVIDLQDDAVVGTTSYYDIDPANRSAAIGYTFYSKRVQGTAVNPEAKLLLLHHAFESSGAVRIVWHTDERNAQSRAAILKLGTTFEGLLRKHRPLPDGTWRTTAQYAMTDDDWPANRDRLQARIA
ncbi:GNAT family N-acetyltransferase [Williamsia phyllosphaerae]|uniref:GNAT family N-acetyltransferase n=1 Tax=Williamsia phyllosphaerae TaxID=885042 RepID=UPI00166AA782|nr:GNAT family protein [Williamsia phyllosphaerae]